MSKRLDYIIIGQGLAGSILSHQLIEHGCLVKVIDAAAPSSASRVAAGIINPVSGKRLVVPENFDKLYGEAMAYYDGLTTRFNNRLFEPLTQWRIFTSASQAEVFTQHRRKGRFDALQEDGEVPTVNTKRFPHGAVRLGWSGRLRTWSLIDEVRGELRRKDALVEDSFDHEALEIEVDGVIYQDLSARGIVFCEGAMGARNPWFQHLPWQLSVGEILTIEMDSRQDSLLNWGRWLLPLGGNRYRLGASNDWDLERSSVSAETADRLIEELREYARIDAAITVIDHQRGIRPSTRDRQPFVGRHPDYPALIMFNGFGGKGALTIPTAANRLCDFLLRSVSLPGGIDVARHSGNGDVPRPSPLTRQAQDFIASGYPDGGLAIDATVGNGLDLEFLCRLAGDNGTVWGFDVQAEAIDRSIARLDEVSLSGRARLIEAGHEEMDQFVPAEHHGRIARIMLNLGYLPGGDHGLTTRTETTIEALQAGSRLLGANGRMSILCYRGHPGGAEETTAVLEWAKGLDPGRFKVTRRDSAPAGPTTPVLLLVARRDQATG